MSICLIDFYQQMFAIYICILYQNDFTLFGAIIAEIFSCVDQIHPNNIQAPLRNMQMRCPSLRKHDTFYFYALGTQRHLNLILHDRLHIIVVLLNRYIL